MKHASHILGNSHFSNQLIAASAAPAGLPIIGDCVAASASDAGQNASWMKVMPTGTFMLRDGRGPFTSGGLAAMQAIINRTAAVHAGTELMVDYDHQGFFGAVPGVGGTAKAAGWVKALEARDDGIYAQVEWTEAARASIKGREYRYLSPLFNVDKNDHVLSFTNIGLVNMPAMALEAVAAQFSQNLKPTETQSMDKIIQALGLAAGASEAAILAAINGTSETMTQIASALSLDDKADGAAIIAAATALTDDRAKLAEALGEDKAATGEKLIAAATKVVGANEPDPSKYVPASAMRAVQDQLNTLQGSVIEDKVTAKVDAAIKEGRLIPAQRDWALKLGKKDMDDLDGWLKDAPLVAASALPKTAKTDVDPVLDDSDRQIAAQMGISEADMIASKKTIPA